MFRVDLNEADWPELSTLPGIGEALARRIVESRAAEGDFVDVDELTRVRGIGPKTLEQLRPYFARSPPRATSPARARSQSVPVCVFFWLCPSALRSDPLTHRGSLALPFDLVSPFQPAGDQPQAIKALIAGLREGRKQQVLMGVTGSGKTFTMANVIQQLAPADAGAVAQQDPGRAALRRVQGVLSAQRGALFRQLLRLLPARGLHPAAGYLHREGRRDQPGDRPAAAGGHQCPGQPPRRDHRGQRVVHLRLGFARRLQGDDGPPGRGADDRPRRVAVARWSTCNTTATTSNSRGASFASAAIASRSGRATRSSACGSNSGGTRSSSCRSSIRPAAR